MKSVLSWSLCVALLFLDYRVSAYSPSPRWGQATAVINNAVFVHGGKTDRFNSYSYTSAPNSDELLFLSLSSGFDGSSPPWELVSSSANSTSAQGPALAWHTLSAFNTSEILLFGGQPGPNSPTVLVDLADSAALLNVYNRLSPEWIAEVIAWAGQPTRRMHHSTASSLSGLVFIIGGEYADGSRNAFPDHHVFDPNISSFSLLPTDNGPPDIYGHTSIILADGRILVFGGFCQTQATLLPFSTIWVLDTTQTTLSWTILDVSSSPLPIPRRAFAAVSLPGGKVLIHGGGDATLQQVYGDGWILDTSQIPATWTPIDALSLLGPRHDHFAISSGNQVIFGFGYGSSAPAPAPLQIYDLLSGSFVPAFSPPPSSSDTQTIPGPSQTSTHSPPMDTPGSSWISSIGGVHPTATVDPGHPGGGDGTPGSGDDNSSNDKGKTTAIAVGAILGVLGLIAVGVGAYYVRRKHQEQGGETRFAALGGDEDWGSTNDSLHHPGGIPVAGNDQSGNGPGANRGIFNTIGLVGVFSAATGGRNLRSPQQRRDMLADEDTRDFGEWYDARRGDGVASSSWSLRSILGGRLRSGEPSFDGTATGAPWGEKADPFSDDATATGDEELGIAGAAGVPVSRPVGLRETSYSSTRTRASYVDPFSDPKQESRDGHQGHGYNAGEDALQRHPDSAEPLPSLLTNLPLPMGTHTLSPLSEHTSREISSLHDLPSSVSSQYTNEPNLSPFESTSRVTSRTSVDSPRSPGSYTTSTLGTPNQPMRRSDSWWSRFSRTSLLDRRKSDASARRSAGMLDIRDPNPLPRLVAIEESTYSNSPHGGDSPKLNAGRGHSILRKGSKPYGGHTKSLSSVNTMKTADTAAIEKMARTMDVVQRMRTGTDSHRTMSSTSSSLTVDTHRDDASWSQDHYQREASDLGELINFSSPTEMTHAEAIATAAEPSISRPVSKTSSPPIIPSNFSSNNTPRPLRVAPPGAVAARIQAYERRLSQDQEVLSATNTKQHEERVGKRNAGLSVNYGLSPRPNLFVANPDHRLMSSEGS